MKQAMTVQVVPPAECARLLERQWRARVYLNSCPFRKLLRLSWMRYYKDRAREQAEEKIFELQSRN